MFARPTIARIARGRIVTYGHVNIWIFVLACAAPGVAFFSMASGLSPVNRILVSTPSALLMTGLVLLLLRPARFEQRPISELQVDDLVVISRFYVRSSGVVGAFLGELGLVKLVRPLMSTGPALESPSKVELVLAAEPRPEVHRAKDTVKVAIPLLVKVPTDRDERKDQVELDDLLALIATGDPTWFRRAPRDELRQAIRLKLVLPAGPEEDEPRLSEAGVALTYHHRDRGGAVGS